MTRVLRLILMTALCVCAWTSMATAQCDVRGELGRAASLLERVERPVEQSGSADARELYRAASRRLREAEARARSGDTENACRLARVSQSLSQQASDVSRPDRGRGSRASGEVEGMLEATDRALEDAAHRLPASRGQGRAEPPQVRTQPAGRSSRRFPGRAVPGRAQVDPHGAGNGTAGVTPRTRRLHSGLALGLRRNGANRSFSQRDASHSGRSRRRWRLDDLPCRATSGRSPAASCAWASGDGAEPDP